MAPTGPRRKGHGRGLDHFQRRAGPDLASLGDSRIEFSFLREYYLVGGNDVGVPGNAHSATDTVINVQRSPSLDCLPVNAMPTDSMMSPSMQRTAASPVLPVKKTASDTKNRLRRKFEWPSCICSVTGVPGLGQLSSQKKRFELLSGFPRHCR